MTHDAVNLVECLLDPKDPHARLRRHDNRDIIMLLQKDRGWCDHYFLLLLHVIRARLGLYHPYPFVAVVVPSITIEVGVVLLVPLLGVAVVLPRIIIISIRKSFPP